MQITLSTEQSHILETLSQQGKYVSLEAAIDTALLLLAEEVTEKNLETTPEYLDWLEQTKVKVDAGVQATEQNDFIDANFVLAQLRQKVETARAKSA